MDAGFGSRLFFVGLMASSCSAMDFWAAATAARSLSGTLRVSNLRLPRWVKRRHMIVPPGLEMLSRTHGYRSYYGFTPRP
jgi:hypothetical protein